MRIQFFYPSKELLPFIKYYWILEIDQSNAEPNRIFPLGSVEMFFHYGDRFRATDSNQNSFLLPRTLISGQKSNYLDIYTTGKTGVIAVMFKPHGARMFFDLPISEILNRNIELELIYGSKIKELEEQIINASDTQQRVLLIENYLKERIKEKYTYDFNRFSNCITEINKTRGLVSLNQLADSTCLSTKQFERKFSEYIGLNPKQFLRIVRLHNSIHAYQNNPNVKLTQIAHDCGFYDQAHFSNEFKQLTGLTPKEFFKNDVTSDYYF